MNLVLIEISVILALILLNGLFALAEIAILSARRVRLQKLADDGIRGAQAALDLAAQPTRFLSTIQSGITLIGVLAGAFGGATIADELNKLLQATVPGWTYSQAFSVIGVVAVITYLSLVIGELVPKQLALVNPERFAVSVAPFILILARIASPFVRLLTISTHTVMRLLPVTRARAASISEADVLYLLEQGAREGIFFEDEREMAKQVLDLDVRPIQSVMTPRLEIDWLDTEDPDEEIKRTIAESPQAAYPVGGGSLDEITGIVRAEELLTTSISGVALNLESLLRPALFVPESASILDVLQQMRTARTHIALVLDEYAGMNGLVTITDILEAIAGDLPVEDEPTEMSIRQREDGSLLVDGLTSVHDLQETINLDLQHELLDSQSQTVAGLVVARMQRIPRKGDRCSWVGVTFEILEMDGVRVDKVIVHPPADGQSFETN